MKELKLAYINIYSILIDIYRNLLIIFLSFLIGFMSVYSYMSYIYKPVYTSTATLAINATDNYGFSVSNLTKTVEVVGVLQTIISSDVLKQKMSEELKRPITGTVATSRLGETNIITLSVTDSTPMSAYETINAVLTNFEGVSGYTFDDIIFTVISPAGVPSAPSNSVSARPRAFLAGVFLAAVCLMAVVFFSYMRDTVKNESDVEALLDSDLLGVVYHEKKVHGLLGRRQYNGDLLISNPLLTYNFAESFRLITVKIEYYKKTTGNNIVLVTSVNENEGKTTVAVNIAQTLAKTGSRVLLIDSDLRKPAMWKNFIKNKDNEKLPNDNFSSFLNGKNDMSQLGFYDSPSGLYLFLNQKSFKNSAEILNSRRYRSLLALTAEQFDYVIVDSPPAALTADSETLASIIPLSILVVNQDYSCVAQINDTIDALKRSGTHLMGSVFNDVQTVAGAITGKHAAPGDSNNKYNR